jgi:IS30 family transposase
VACVKLCSLAPNVQANRRATPMLAKYKTRAGVARQLLRHRSTIGRELRRNVTTHDAQYQAEKAHSFDRLRHRQNGLLRQYLPKGTCLSSVTQARCNQIADDLNHRPRKRHGFKTHAALYHRN